MNKVDPFVHSYWDYDQEMARPVLIARHKDLPPAQKEAFHKWLGEDFNVCTLHGAYYSDYATWYDAWSRGDKLPPYPDSPGIFEINERPL